MNVKRITVFVLCVIVSIGMLRAATNNENQERDTDRTVVQMISLEVMP